MEILILACIWVCGKQQTFALHCYESLLIARMCKESDAPKTLNSDFLETDCVGAEEALLKCSSSIMNSRLGCAREASLKIQTQFPTLHILKFET